MTNTNASRLAVLVILYLVPVGTALGFWSGFTIAGNAFTIAGHTFTTPGHTFPPVHQNITRGALGSPLYQFGSSGPYSFSTNAIEAVNAMHRVADSDPYDPRNHFDSESFVDSYTLLRNRYAQLRAVLSPAAGSFVDTTTAWSLLGMMLHAAQDFYSHSTWVYGNTSIVDFGSYISSGTTPSFLLFPAQIGSACFDGVDFSSARPPITTGYYPAGSSADGVYELFEPLPSGKCEHGRLATAFLRCYVSSITPFDGINLDASCEFTNVPSRAMAYRLAENAARDETVALIQHIIGDLQAANNGPGFCALLGLGQSLRVCSSAGLTGDVISGSYDYPAFGIPYYAFSYSTNPVTVSPGGATTTFNINGGLPCCGAGTNFSVDFTANSLTVTVVSGGGLFCGCGSSFNGPVFTVTSPQSFPAVSSVSTNVVGFSGGVTATGSTIGINFQGVTIPNGSYVVVKFAP